MRRSKRGLESADNSVTHPAVLWLSLLGTVFPSLAVQLPLVLMQTVDAFPQRVGTKER